MKKKYILSFIIPISIILLIFLVLGIYPFGDLSISIIDSDTQYVEFISYLKSIIFSNNDFKYTFSASLGQNFLPLMGYYLMSPLNLITLLFNAESMKCALTLIMIIKIGLCGLSFNYYISKKKDGLQTLIFSTAYALMSFNIVYIYHTMWLDSIILFPIVILGLDNIFNKKSPILYIISLSLSIILNYYMGLIICLGTVIYFIYKYIKEYKIINKLSTFINYSISSLLSGFISMIIIIPSIMGLQSSKATFDLSNLSLSLSTSYLRVIAKSFTAAFGDGETWKGGPMISCGMLILVLLVLYFINKKINKRDKIASGFLLIFTTTTFVITALDLIFHGLTIPNCFDFRHAFLLVFFMLIIAYDSFNKLNYDNKKLKYIFGGFTILSLIIYLCNFKFNRTTYGLTILLSLLIVFSIILVLKNKKNLIKYLLIIELIDLTIGASSAFITIVYSDKQSTKNYYNYVNNVNNVVEKLNKIDNSFYRTEKTFNRNTNESMLSINDSMIFNYNGISHFDSTTNKDVELFLEKLGYRRLISRAYYNKEGSTTFADSLLGIKYVLSYDQYKNYEKLTNDEINIYKNPYALSIGYVVNKNIYNTVIDGNNTFEIQNTIAKNITGISNNIYNKASYSIDSKNLVLEDNIYKGNGVLNYKIDITSNDELYFYFPPSDEIQTEFQNARMYINGKYVDDYFTKYNWGVMSLGKHNIGDTLLLSFEVNDKLEINDSYFYYEDINVLEECYKILSNNELKIIKNTSSNLTATINLNKKSAVLFTIPYDKGWKILVDNKIVKQEKVLNVLTSINLEKGNHKIKLIYTPPGLNLGICVSSISIGLSIIYIIIYKKIKK